MEAETSHQYAAACGRFMTGCTTGQNPVSGTASEGLEALRTAGQEAGATILGDLRDVWINFSPLPHLQF